MATEPRSRSFHVSELMADKIVQAFRHNSTGELRLFLHDDDTVAQLDPGWEPLGPFLLLRRHPLVPPRLVPTTTRSTGSTSREGMTP